MLILFFRKLFCIITRLKLYRPNIPSRATIGPPAKRQLSDFKYKRCLLGTGSNSLDPDQAPSFVKNSEYDQKIPQTSTNPWHRGEEPHNHNETPGRQLDDCKTRMDITI